MLSSTPRLVRRLVALGVLLGLAAGLSASAEPAGPDARKPDPKALRDRLKPGMKAAEVTDLLGPPRRVARQILYSRYVEQWTYDEPVAVRIEFDWRKGQEKQIQTVQPLTIPPR